MSASFWSSFRADPRRAENARMRASDADRGVVEQLLTEAYADGRLTRDELDERTTAMAEARTLGELPALVDDLVEAGSPDDARADAVPVRVPPGELRARAEEAYRSDRREAVLGFVGPSLICLVVWWVVMYGEFFWPAFVLAGTGMNLVRVLVQRDDLVAGHVERLEKKERRALEGGGDTSS